LIVHRSAQAPRNAEHGNAAACVACCVASAARSTHARRARLPCQAVLLRGISPNPLITEREGRRSACSAGRTTCGSCRRTARVCLPGPRFATPTFRMSPVDAKAVPDFEGGRVGRGGEWGSGGVGGWEDVPPPPSVSVSLTLSLSHPPTLPLSHSPTL
jgi:hypothetical protein